MKNKTCKECDNFIGAGDWNLCCKNPPEDKVGWCGFLCYEDTPACGNFKERSLKMGKAFQCDNCLDCFPGDAHEVLTNGADVCSGCFKAMKALDMIKPIKLRPDRPENWELTDFPLHTGRHSQ